LVRTTINAGICGFTTTVLAQSEDMQNVTLSIESDCENISRLAQELSDVDGYKEIGAGFDGVILRTVRKSVKGCCAGCVVPCGIFKSMQVAAGLALPAPCSIDIQRE